MAQFFNTPHPRTSLLSKPGYGHDYIRQHLKWIKKVQSRSKTWTRFDPLQMLTSVLKLLKCSCGSVEEHWVSSAKVVGSIPRFPVPHILTKKCITWLHCKSFWIKASAKCIKEKNVNTCTKHHSTSTALYNRPILYFPAVTATAFFTVYSLYSAYCACCYCSYCKCTHIVHTAMFQSLASTDYTTGALECTVWQ